MNDIQNMLIDYSNAKVLHTHNLVLGEFVRSIYLLNILSQTRKLNYKITVSQLDELESSGIVHLTVLAVRKGKRCNKWQNFTFNADTYRGKISTLEQIVKFVLPKSYCTKKSKFTRAVKSHTIAFNNFLINYIIDSGIKTNGDKILRGYERYYKRLGEVMIGPEYIGKPVARLFDRQNILDSLKPAKKKAIGDSIYDDPEFKIVMQCAPNRLPARFKGQSVAAVSEQLLSGIMLDKHVLPGDGRYYDSTKYQVYNPTNVQNNTHFASGAIKQYFQNIALETNELFIEKDNQYFNSHPEDGINEFKSRFIGDPTR